VLFWLFYACADHSSLRPFVWRRCFQVGTINAAFLLMAGIVSLPLGLLSDRLGRKLLIVTGLALASCSSFLLSFSSSTIQLVAIHLLLGVSLGCLVPP